jgi:hypothetical protein
MTTPHFFQGEAASSPSFAPAPFRVMAHDKPDVQVMLPATLARNVRLLTGCPVHVFIGIPPCVDMRPSVALRAGAPAPVRPTGRPFPVVKRPHHTAFGFHRQRRVPRASAGGTGDWRSFVLLFSERIDYPFYKSSYCTILLSADNPLNGRNPWG